MTGVRTRGGAIGDCTIDQFSITSAGNQRIPSICGFNTGQHMIFDSDGSSCHSINFFIGGTAFQRNWDIKISQYQCNDYEYLGGPPDCLQYHTGATGNIKSFNFGTTTGTHLTNQNYAICIRREAGNCRICYEPITSGLS